MPLKQETQNENKETRQHLLECAKREFLEKGYMKASLRNICKEAGVTTGALYFFFKDKEDLLAALVEEPLRQLYAIMEEHYATEMHNEDQVAQLDIADDGDLEASRQIIRQMYANREAFLLLLTKSQGSRFENCRNCESDGPPSVRFGDKRIYRLQHGTTGTNDPRLL